MSTGKIKTLYSDKEKTEALFPRTKTSAISDANGIGLDALIEHSVYADTEAIETTTAPLDADTLGGRTPDEYAPAGYGLGTTSPFHEIATAAGLNQFTMNGTYAIHCVSPLVIGGWSIEWFTVRVTNWDAETLVQEMYVNGYSLVMRRICDHNNWGEWEWINPPLAIGVEYRTTERYNGKVVYTKLVQFGALPNKTEKSVTAMPAGASLIEAVGYASGSSYNVPIPGYYGIQSFGSTRSSGNLWLSTTIDMSSYNGWITIKYTKD